MCLTAAEYLFGELGDISVHQTIMQKISMTPLGVLQSLVLSPGEGPTRPATDTHRPTQAPPHTDHRHTDMHTDKNVPRHRDTQRHRYTKTLGHTHKHTDRYTNPTHTHTQIPDSSPVQNRKVRITQQR